MEMFAEVNLILLPKLTKKLAEYWLELAVNISYFRKHPTPTSCKQPWDQKIPVVVEVGSVQAPSRYSVSKYTPL